MSNSAPKVFVGMSGGVDSSVAAHLLKKDGYDVVGVFLRCYNLDGCAEQDARDARRAAEHLGIPFYVWDFEKEYKEKVVEYMVEGYKSGITPNPDVMCNREIKFGLFFEKAREMGADFVATGHYVKVANSKGLMANSKNKNPSAMSYSLLAARDASKDQSYFLWTLTQDQLKYCLFPIGDYIKSEVREIARSAGLKNAEKKDSQGICFLGQVTLDDFLSRYVPAKQGNVFDVRGEKIGEHFGAHLYTIGERHTNIVYSPHATRPDMKPRYVAETNVEKNTVTVVEGDNAPELYRKEINLTDVNFITPDIDGLIRANGSMNVMARVRYRQELTEATLVACTNVVNARNVVVRKHFNKRSDRTNSTFKLTFASPQKFVAPGQSAVFYAEDGTMLGGGVIV